MKKKLLFISLMVITPILLVQAQNQQSNTPGGLFKPTGPELPTQEIQMLDAQKAKDGGFATTVFTFDDIIVFSYFDNTEFQFYDANNDLLATETLDADEFHNFITGQGVYRIVCNNTFTVLVGDAVTNTVNGYFAVDESGRGTSTKLNTYMMSPFDSNDDFIVFAYEDNTSFTVRNLETNAYIYGTSLNAGEYLSFAQIDAIPYSTAVQVLSDKPVSALSYTDQDYYVPSSNGTFTGELFYGYSGYAGSWANSITVAAYYDDTEVTITNLDTGDEIETWTLQEGQVGTYPIYDKVFWKVQATNPVTASNIPYGTWSGNYYYMTKAIDRSGTGAGTLFYVPTIGSRIDVFSFAADNEITITRLGQYDQFPYDNSSIVWEGTLEEGQGYNFNSSSGSWVYKIEGTENMSVLQSNGGFGADFMALEYSFDLPDLAVSSSDIAFSVSDTVFAPRDEIDVTFTVHNYGLAEASNIVCEVYLNDPDGSDQVSPYYTEVLEHIESYGSESFTVPVVVPSNPEYRSIYIVVDPDNDILESNLSNNKAQRSFRPNIDLLPPLAVNSSAPMYLDFVDGILAPNPFDVQFDVFNNGTEVLHDVEAHLSFEGGLSLYAEKSMWELGDLQVGASHTMEVKIQADPDSLGYNFYSLTFMSGDEEIKTINRMVVVGEIPASVSQPGFVLHDISAHPNPFSQSVHVDYSLDARKHVKVKVYDVRGVLIQTLADGIQSEGHHQLMFTPDSRSAGMYFIYFESDGQSQVKRVVYSK